MQDEQLASITQAQRERLFHIDFKLFFLGSVNRTDLVSRFGIKVYVVKASWTNFVLI